MRFPSLFKRREFWWPTWPGWLLISGALLMLCTAAARQAESILAPNAPTSGARILVVEGWLSAKELDQALIPLSSGNYSSVITTGGPLTQVRGTSSPTDPSNYADLVASYLSARTKIKIVSVPAPASAQDRTYLSAVMVRRWAEQHGGHIEALDVFSSGFHARRTQSLYRTAFGTTTTIGIIPANPDEYSVAYWWRSSAGVKALISETVGLAWMLCCFDPAEPGSAAELWGIRDK